MKKLRTLAVSFDTQVNPWELPRFRGAMAHKVGLEHEWFHNHNNETGGFHQRYPLIQYKIDPYQTLLRLRQDYWGGGEGDREGRPYGCGMYGRPSRSPRYRGLCRKSIFNPIGKHTKRSYTGFAVA